MLDLPRITTNHRKHPRLFLSLSEACGTASTPEEPQDRKLKLIPFVPHTHTHRPKVIPPSQTMIFSEELNFKLVR